MKKNIAFFSLCMAIMPAIGQQAINLPARNYAKEMSVMLSDMARYHPKYTPDQLIVKFKPTGQAIVFTPSASVRTAVRTDKYDVGQFGIPEVDQLNAKHGCNKAYHMFGKIHNVSRSPDMQNVYELKFDNAQDIPSLINEYMATGLFDYVQPDFIGGGGGAMGNVVPNDTYFSSRQWALHNNGTFNISPESPTAKAGADMQMECAWGVSTGSANTVVAILDEGCQVLHPEFGGNGSNQFGTRIWVNKGEIAGNGKDDDNNGYVDDRHGWDFAGGNTSGGTSNGVGDSNVTDVYGGGHGTNVAGIIGADGNNGVGYAGINWKCQLMIVRVDGNNDQGQTSWWDEGIDYATQMGANVINMSIFASGVSSDPTMQSAVNAAFSKGVVCVAAMGNNYNNTPGIPAALTHIIAVGATSSNDWVAHPLGGSNSNALPGSNYNTYISVCAPGDEIYGLYNQLPDNYNEYWYGTSQATPHVAGLASLMLAVNPNLTPTQVQSLMEKTADKGTGVGDPNDNPTSFNDYYGYGRINACRALDTLISPTGLRDFNEPAPSVLIYPNPFSDKAEMVINNINRPGQMVEVDIYDMVGEKVKQINTNQKQIEISRDGMSNGLYFYMAVSGQQILGAGKFMVMGN